MTTLQKQMQPLKEGFATEIKTCVENVVDLYAPESVISRDDIVDIVSKISSYKEPFKDPHIKNDGKPNATPTSYTRGSLQVEFAMKKLTTDNIVDFIGNRKWVKK